MRELDSVEFQLIAPSSSFLSAIGHHRTAIVIMAQRRTLHGSFSVFTQRKAYRRHDYYRRFWSSGTFRLSIVEIYSKNNKVL